MQNVPEGQITMSTPYRPAVDAILMRMAQLHEHDICSLSVADVRAMAHWVMHLERMMLPAQRTIVMDHARCQLCYELSNAGHILWVTYHHGSKRVRPTQVAAVRVRSGWQINGTVAPADLTDAALETLAPADYGDDSHGQESKQPVLP